MRNIIFTIIFTLDVWIAVYLLIGAVLLKDSRQRWLALGLAVYVGIHMYLIGGL